MPPVEAPIATMSKSSRSRCARLASGGAGASRRRRRVRSAATSRSLEHLGETPAEARRRPGLTSVSAAPSASASTVAAAPSSQAEETIRTLRALARGDQVGKRGQAVDARHLDIEQDDVDLHARARNVERRLRVAHRARDHELPVGRRSCARSPRARPTESSTISSADRARLSLGVRLVRVHRGWLATTAPASGHADDLQLAFERLAVERLHDIFVGARLDRGADMAPCRSRWCRTRPWA